MPSQGLARRLGQEWAATRGRRFSLSPKSTPAVVSYGGGGSQGSSRMAKAYRIKNWDKHFESSHSRAVKTTLTWVRIPNKHDGNGYLTIMEHERASEIFTAWIQIVQVASKCDPRGTLVASSGVPLTVARLASMTRGRKEWFEIALEVLTSSAVGWIETIPVEDDSEPGAKQTQSDCGELQPDCGATQMRCGTSQRSPLSPLSPHPTPSAPSKTIPPKTGTFVRKVPQGKVFSLEEEGLGAAAPQGVQRTLGAFIVAIKPFVDSNAGPKTTGKILNNFGFRQWKAIMNRGVDAEQAYKVACEVERNPTKPRNWRGAITKKLCP